jgi:hypothetical protein
MATQQNSEGPIKEAFYLNSAGEEFPCDRVRFAVGDRDSGIRSAIWSAMYSKGRKSDDMFLVSDGNSDDIKVSFHSRDAIVAYRSEKMVSLIERGAIAPESRRQTESVPILPDPFLVASIAFFPGVMKPEKHRVRPPGTPITIIECPPIDQFLRVHVVHSFNEPAHLQDHVSGDYMTWFARLRSGNRHLTFFKIPYPCDWEKERGVLRAYASHIPAREDLLALARQGNLSAIFWGHDDTHLNFFEVHGLEAVE